MVRRVPRTPLDAPGLAKRALTSPRSVCDDWSEGAASYLKEARGGYTHSVCGQRPREAPWVTLSRWSYRIRTWARTQPRLRLRPGEAMAKVSVLNVAVLENPSPFHSPFRFEISFECNEALADGEAGPVWTLPPPPGACGQPDFPVETLAANFDLLCEITPNYDLIPLSLLPL